MTSLGGLKRPFKLDFDHFVEGQRFHKLNTVALSNHALVPSHLREALSYAIYRAAGVSAPRTAFVQMHLTVDGKHDRRFTGLYTLIEPINKTFLKTHFGSSKGLLLKPETFMPGGNVPYLGEDWEKYKEAYQPKNDATPAQQRRLIEFAKLVHRADDKTFRRKIDAYLDVDEFLRYLAVTALLVNLDSFTSMNHNYFLYLDPKTNKFQIFPWDVDMTLGGFAFGGPADQQAQWSIVKPHMGAPNRL